MGLEHVLFVTSGLRGTGIIDDHKGQFEQAGVSVTVYDEVESNPKDYNVMDAYQLYTDEKCDGFVSIGGGSSTDCTKGARVVAAHDGRNVNEFQGTNVSEKLANPPHIAINTTVGTGSETTPFYVITDTTSENAPHKWVGFDQATTTTLAINDPVLMMTQPPQYVAYTGFDTLAHATEAYTNRIAMPSIMPEALRAAKLVEENLREAASNPQNAEAMTNMCWAQYMAGQAFSSGLLGILHSLSHALCAFYDIHHGLNNGVYQDALEQAVKRMVHHLRVRRARSFSPGEVAAESGTQELPLDLVDVQFEELLDELREQGVAPELVEAVQASAEEILAALSDLLRSLIDRQERLRAARAQEPLEPDRALRRLLDLSPGDQRELELAIRRLARRLHGAPTRRLRPARRGKVSVPQTLRRNMAHEGVPFAPVLRRRREQRPRLVVLLDVSLSTCNLARFWLALVWELQSLFSRVRTFAFVADLVEVTPLFAEQGLEAGVQTLFAGELIDVDGNSDFGRAIEELYEAHLGALTRRTTLVVLGDGRNNGRSPNTTRFAVLTRRCRRTLWMTPEPRWGWQLGSCDMPAYAEACDAVEVARSVEELGHLAEQVLAE